MFSFDAIGIPMKDFLFIGKILWRNNLVFGLYFLIFSTSCLYSNNISSFGSPRFILLIPIIRKSAAGSLVLRKSSLFATPSTTSPPIPLFKISGLSNNSLQLHCSVILSPIKMIAPFLTGKLLKWETRRL